MIVAKLSSVFRVVVAAAFLWVQVAGIAHAAEHGDHPHEHDGVECQIIVIAADDAVILPAPPELSFKRLHGDVASVVSIAESAWAWPPERGPPPRSPPAVRT